MNTKNRLKLGLRLSIESALSTILSLIPKKRKLVLFTAWFGQKYIDNTMYVYEYLLENTDYNPIWLTTNIDVFNKLRSEGKPVAMRNSLKGIIYQIRCVAVFSTVQFSDYNIWLLTNCLYIDLGHGHPIKDSGDVVTNDYVQNVQNFWLKKINFYSIVASQFAKSLVYQTVNCKDDHIIISDFARNDVFVDPKLSIGKNSEIDQIKNGRKAIVYMPTHRSDGKKIMELSEILPLNEIQNLCEKNNYVFIIKKHFYHRNEVEDLSSYSNIFDVTSVENLDPQVLLMQADILISDYSACYIDYLLLNRPLLFYHYDIDIFQKTERSLFIPFEKLNICPIAYKKSDFISDLESLMSQNEDPFQKRRIEFSHTYFDNIKQENGREKIKEILDLLLNNGK